MNNNDVFSTQIVALSHATTCGETDTNEILVALLLTISPYLNGVRRRRESFRRDPSGLRDERPSSAIRAAHSAPPNPSFPP
jgi:hypothetical protein